MNSQTRITLRQFCDYFHVDFDLARELAEFGLYPVVINSNEIEIETRDLYKLKKIITLHQLLGINKEGIKTILSLGERICDLQKEVEILQNELKKLKLYEEIKEAETLKRRGLLIEIDGFFTTLDD
jgi:hypothetical protein